MKWMMQLIQVNRSNYYIRKQSYFDSVINSIDVGNNMFFYVNKGRGISRENNKKLFYFDFKFYNLM